MDINMDKDTQEAWKGWVVFTHFAAGAVVVVAVILGLMAAFIL